MARPLLTRAAALLTLSLALAAAPVQSQDAARAAPAPAPSPPSAPASDQRVTVVAVPNNEEQRRGATLLMTVIGREDLDAYGDSSVLDVLARVSGVGIEGEQPRLRGLGGGYTLILLNGEPAPAGFSLDSLAPGDIERIEIVKGPSAEHGGVAGSINLILRRPLPRQQQEFRAQLGHRAVDGQGSLAWVAGRRDGPLASHWTLSAYSWANGGTGRSERNSRDAQGQARDSVSTSQDAWRGGGVQAAPRLEWRLSAQDSVNWQGFAQAQRSRNRVERETQVLRGTPPAAPFEQGSSGGQTQHWRSQWQWLHKADDGRRIEWRLSLQDQLQRARSATLGQDAAGMGVVDRATASHTRNHQSGWGTRWRWPLGDSQTLSLGADLERRQRQELAREFSWGQERVSGSLGRSFTATAHKGLLFAQHEWQPHAQWAWVAGLRLEAAQTQTQAASAAAPGLAAAKAAAGAKQRWQAVLPSLNLRHALDAKGQQVLRLGVSRSIRVPELTLLMPRYALTWAYGRDVPNTPLAADSAGNPALKPERAQGLELAWEKQIGPGGSLSVGLFTRRIDGLIRRRIGLETVAEATVQRWVSRPVNFGHAHAKGLELEARGPAEDLLGIGEGHGFRLRSSISVYRSKVEQVDDPDARLEGQPPWTATLGVDQQLPKSSFSWGATLMMTPAFATAQTDRQRLWRSAVRQLDLSLRWRFSRQTQLNLALRNALPQDARSFSSISDIDGFTATSGQSRSGNVQLNLSFTHRLALADGG